MVFRQEISPALSGNNGSTPEPIVLKTEGTHGPVIHAANSAALALGMQPGARITDMRALVPDLRVEDAAPERDAADLAMLERWTRRWCPWSAMDGLPEASAGLLLDTTGTAHLHAGSDNGPDNGPDNGEASLAAEMLRAFSRLGLTAHVALAPTIGAAWALARYGGRRRIICADEAQAARLLAPLPAAALRLDAPTVLLLRRLGLKTVGSLIELPREALIRRFRKAEKLSANPVQRLDQATGRQPELLVSPTIRPPLRVHRKFAEPLLDLTGLTQVLRDLAGDLCNAMEGEQRGARALRFTAYRVDGDVLTAEARTSRATRDAAHLAALFDGKLDWIDPGFGIEAAGLEATDSEILPGAQDDLTGSKRDDMAFSRLIDRLVQRLGITRVLRPVLRGSHLPERGEYLAPASGEASVEKAGKAAGSITASSIPARRAATPLRLLNRPEEAEVIHAVPDGPPARFRWRHKLHDVTRSAGPERIAPEWWREKSRTRLRDYYHVEDDEGRRYWLFREGLAGDGRGGVWGETPRWFVHGLDA